jgi:hypothetical protein
LFWVDWLRRYVVLVQAVQQIEGFADRFVSGVVAMRAGRASCVPGLRVGRRHGAG